MSWPTELQINAWLGAEKRAASCLVSADAKKWPLRNAPPKVRTFLKPPAPVDVRDWQNSDVGWGVVAAESEGLTDAQKQTSSDLPEPIQALIKDRGDAPVFRYRPGWISASACCGATRAVSMWRSANRRRVSAANASRATS